jgi:hypothetical protein
MTRPTPDLIAAIRRAKPADADEDAWISGQLANIQDVVEHLRLCERRRAEVRDEAAKRLAAIDADLAKIRGRCRHWKSRHHGDPAGGSDSFTECEICGKEL